MRTTIDCRRLGLALLIVIGIVVTDTSRSTAASQQTNVQVPSHSITFGAFTARFDPSGTFTLEGEGWPRLTGTWKINADQVELSTTGVNGCNGPGRYRLRV